MFHFICYTSYCKGDNLQPVEIQIDAFFLIELHYLYCKGANLEPYKIQVDLFAINHLNVREIIYNHKKFKMI